MSYDFNAQEILEMAEQIERNGAKFYKSAAENISEPVTKEFLLDLAKMEQDHEKTFAQLKTELSQKEKELTVFDPDGEMEQYLHSLADIRVFFEKDIDTSSFEGVIKAAIVAEKDSIVFYLGMKELVPDNLGKDKIDAIIKEEMNHVSLLSKKLVAVKKHYF